MPPLKKEQEKKETLLKIEGMEAYKTGLLWWLEREIRKEMLRGVSKMSDVYIGKMNAYKDFIDHIKGNLRKKKSHYKKTI